MSFADGGFVVLNPVGEVGRQRAQEKLSPRLSSLATKRLGLLDDGFSGSDIYFKEIERLLREGSPDLVTRHWVKEILSRPAPQSLVEEVASQSDAVIVGLCA
ncbi:MAG: hypothetical protein HYY00_00460 [Chloroflexi bacterium]|nr:hypothetical protein [Chloroflexota bacterium]